MKGPRSDGKIRAIVQAPDPVILAGITGLLEPSPGFEVLVAEEVSKAKVLVFLLLAAHGRRAGMLRRSASTTGLPVVLVIDGIDASELLIAVENRVVAILPRGALTVSRLAHAVITPPTRRWVT